MTELSDKSAVEHIQQRMCMRLAEVLLRGSFDGSYLMASGSRAISQKASSLKYVYWVYLQIYDKDELRQSPRIHLADFKC